MQFLSDSEQKIIDFLSSKTNFSKTKIKQLIKYNRVKVNETIVKSALYVVKKGDRITIDLQNKQNLSSKKCPLPILFEDELFIAIDKPAGIQTSGEDVFGKITAKKLLDIYLKDKTKGKQQIYVVHRLDKEVSGVMIFAKNIWAQQWLKNNWHRTTKIYLAIVHGSPKEDSGIIKTYLYDTPQQKVKISLDPSTGKLAITEYKVLEKFDKYSLLEIKLHTGRKNQIRAHLSHIGCPIVGDFKYGADNKYIRQIRLHSHILEFIHPKTNQKISLKSLPPKNFKNILDHDENYK